MTPEYVKKREDLFSSALHQISTRALRDAPVYLEHVSSAKQSLERGIDRLVAAEVSRRELALLDELEKRAVTMLTYPSGYPKKGISVAIIDEKRQALKEES